MAEETRQKGPAHVASSPSGTAYPPGQAGYSAPPPAYYPAANPPNTVVVSPGYMVAHQPVAVSPCFGPAPVRVRCPHCSMDVQTELEYHTGNLTWLVCLGAAFVGCFLGCCLIPFCVDETKDAVHRCPNCKQQVGIYRRL